MSLQVFQQHFLYKLQTKYNDLDYLDYTEKAEFVTFLSDTKKTSYDKSLRILQTVFAKGDFTKQIQIAELLAVLDSKDSVDRNGNLINLTKEQSYLFEDIFDIVPVQIVSPDQDLYAISADSLKMVYNLMNEDFFAEGKSGFENNLSDSDAAEVSDIKRNLYQGFQEDSDFSQREPLFKINDFDLLSSLGNNATIKDIKDQLTVLKDNNEKLTLYEFNRVRGVIININNSNLVTSQQVDDSTLYALYLIDRQNQKDLEGYGLNRQDDIEIGSYPKLPSVGSKQFDFFSYVETLLEDIVIYTSDSDKPIIDQSQFLRLINDKLRIAIVAKETFEGNNFSLKSIKDEFELINSGSKTLKDVLEGFNISKDVIYNISTKISERKGEVESARISALKDTESSIRGHKINKHLAQITSQIISSNCGDYLITANDSLKKGDINGYIKAIEEAVRKTSISEQYRAILIYSVIEQMPPEKISSLSLSGSDIELLSKFVREIYGTPYGANDKVNLKADKKDVVEWLKKRLEADASRLKLIRRASPQPIILDSTSQKTDIDQICADFSFYNTIDFLSKKLYAKYYSPTSGYTHLDREEDEFDKIEDLVLHYDKENNFKILIEVAKTIDISENSQRQYLVQALKFLESPSYNKDRTCRVSKDVQLALKNLFGMPATDYDLKMVDIEGIKERLKDYDLSNLFQISKIQGHDQFQEILDGREEEGNEESKKLKIARCMEEFKSEKTHNKSQEDAKDNILEIFRVALKNNEIDKITKLLEGLENNKFDAKLFFGKDEKALGFKGLLSIFLEAQLLVSRDATTESNITEIKGFIGKAIDVVKSYDVITNKLDQKAVRIGKRLRVNLQIPGQNNDKNLAINNLIQLSQIGLSSGSKDNIEGLLKRLTQIQSNVGNYNSPNAEILADCEKYFESSRDAIMDVFTKEKFKECYDSYMAFLESQFDANQEGKTNIDDLKQVAAAVIYEINEAEIDVAMHEVAKAIKYYNVNPEYKIDAKDYTILEFLEDINTGISLLKVNFNGSKKSSRSLDYCISEIKEYASVLHVIKDSIIDELPHNKTKDKGTYKIELEGALNKSDIPLKRRLNLELQLKNIDLDPYKSKKFLTKNDESFLESQADFEIDSDLEYRATKNVKDGDLNEAILEQIFTTSRSSAKPLMDQRKDLEIDIFSLIVDYHSKDLHDKSNGLGQLFEEYKRRNETNKFFKIIQNILTKENPFESVTVAAGDNSKESEIDKIQNALNEEIDDKISEIIEYKFRTIQKDAADFENKAKETLAQEPPAIKTKLISDVAIFNRFFSAISNKGQLNSFNESIELINELVAQKRFGDELTDKVNDVDNIINKVLSRQDLQEAKEIIISPLRTLIDPNTRQANIHHIFKNKRFGNNVTDKESFDLLLDRSRKYYEVIKEEQNERIGEQTALDHVFRQELSYFNKFSKLSRFEQEGFPDSSTENKRNAVFYICDLLKNRSSRSTFNAYNISDIRNFKTDDGQFNLHNYQAVNSFVESVLSSKDSKNEEIGVRIAKKNFDQLSKEQQLEIYQSYIISQYYTALDNAKAAGTTNSANQSVEYFMIAKFIEEEFGLVNSPDSRYYFKNLSNLDDVQRKGVDVSINDRIQKLIDLRGILIGHNDVQDIEVLQFNNDKTKTLEGIYAPESEYFFDEQGDEIRELLVETLEDSDYSKTRIITQKMAVSSQFKSLIERRDEYDQLALKALSDIQNNPHEFKENQASTIKYACARAITDHINKRFLDNIYRLSDSGIISQLDEEVSRLVTDIDTIRLRIRAGDISSIDDILLNEDSPFIVGGKEISKDTTDIIRASFLEKSKFKGNEYSAYPQELHDVLYKGQNIARLESLNNDLIDKINISQLYDPNRYKSQQDSTFATSAWFETEIILPKEIFGKVEKRDEHSSGDNLHNKLDGYKAFVKMAIALNMENEIIEINRNFPRKATGSETNQALSEQRLASVEAVYARYEEFLSHTSEGRELDTSRFYDVDIKTLEEFKGPFQDVKNRRYIRESLDRPHTLNYQEFQVAKSVFKIATRATNLSHTGNLYEINNSSDFPAQSRYSKEAIDELELRKKTLYKEAGKLGSSLSKDIEYSKDDRDLKELKEEKEDAKIKAGGILRRNLGPINDNIRKYNALEAQYQKEVDQRYDDINKEINKRSPKNNLKVQKFFHETSKKRSPGIKHNLANVSHNLGALTTSANESQKKVIVEEIKDMKKELAEGSKETRDFIWKIKNPVKGTLSGLFSTESSRNKKRNAATKLASIMYDNIHYLDKGDESGEDIFNAKVATYIEGLVSSSSEYSEKEMKGFFRFIKNAYVLARDDNKIRKDITTFLGFCGNRQEFKFPRKKSVSFFNKTHFENEHQGELEEDFRARADAALEQFDEIDKGLRSLTTKLTINIQSSFGKGDIRREKVVADLENKVHGDSPSFVIIPTEAERFMERVQYATRESFSNIFDNIRVDGKCSIYYHKGLYNGKVKGDGNDQKLFSDITKMALVNAINKLSPDDRAIIIAGDAQERFDDYSEGGVMDKLNKKFMTEIKAVGISKCESAGVIKDLQLGDIPTEVTQDLVTGNLFTRDSATKALSELTDLSQKLVEYSRHDSRNIDIKKTDFKNSPSGSALQPKTKSFLERRRIGDISMSQG